MDENDRSHETIHAEIAALQQQIRQLEAQLPPSSLAAHIIELTAFEGYLSEQRFRTLLDTASIAIVVADNSGHILLANQKASDMFGYARETLIGSPVGMLLPERLRLTHDEHLHRFFANPRPRPMGQGMDLMAQRADGSLFPIEVSLSAIQSDAGVQGVAFIADISERQQNETRFQTLLDTASIAIVVIDNAGQITVANQKASEIFGYTAGELIGSSVGILLPEQLRVGHDEHLMRFFSSPRPRPMGQGMDLMAQRQDGTQFPIEVSLSAIQSEGGMQGVAFIVDISERKRAEQQHLDLLAEQERMKALQSFVVDVAHDLKTPMAAIMTRLHLIDKQLGPEAEVHTRKLYKHIERLNHLVDTMLVMTRLDMVEQLDMQNSNINHLVHDAAASLHTEIQAKEHQLHYHLDAALPTMRVHPSYLTMAVKNMLHNAIIFTPQNGDIEVHTYQEQAAVCIEIRDTGIGIASEDIPHIFKRFYRTDSARGMDDSINGLGLAISKRVIDLHHGQIIVTSVLGQGSTFKIVLPIEPYSAPAEDSGSKLVEVLLQPV
jgi:PAS domain S-box-containing protein